MSTLRLQPDREMQAFDGDATKMQEHLAEHPLALELGDKKVSAELVQKIHAAATGKRLGVARKLLSSALDRRVTNKDVRDFLFLLDDLLPATPARDAGGSATSSSMLISTGA